MANNLEAALQSLRSDQEKGRLSKEVAKSLRRFAYAYHSEPERPHCPRCGAIHHAGEACEDMRGHVPAKPDWKVEAGAEVQFGGRTEWRGVVLFVDGNGAAFRQYGSSGWDRVYLAYLRVTKPAVPEVGDTARTKDGLNCIIAGERTGGFWTQSKCGSIFFKRDDFTITCKARKEEDADG